MRLIYLSPHLDDAVLSAGGWLYEQARHGLPVEVWTLMSGFPPEEAVSNFARQLHEKWGVTRATEAVRLRRMEDLAATARLALLPVHFDFLDCIYRRDARGEPLYPQDVFVPPHPADQELPDRIADLLKRRLQPEDRVACQLGIGSHVDHRLVRRAAERLSRPLIYLADLPYLFDHPAELPIHTAGMQKQLYEISKAGLTSWLEAIEAYRSQLPTLFKSPEQMQQSYRRYLLEQGGFPTWQVNAEK
ncbi:MAG: PIG-L deacetylase family protein [Anaerolineae bacterium]